MREYSLDAAMFIALFGNSVITPEQALGVCRKFDWVDLAKDLLGEGTEAFEEFDTDDTASWAAVEGLIAQATEANYSKMRKDLCLDRERASRELAARLQRFWGMRDALLALSFAALYKGIKV